MVHPCQALVQPLLRTDTLSEGLILSKHKEYSLISLSGMTIEVE